MFLQVKDSHHKLNKTTCFKTFLLVSLQRADVCKNKSNTVLAHKTKPIVQSGKKHGLSSNSNELIILLYAAVLIMYDNGI